VSIEKNEGCVCSCDTCKSMCDRPCWPAPSEAEALIEAGYGDKLMLDHWVGSPQDNPAEEYCGDTRILAPACKGYEGRRAPFWPEGGCAFQNENNLCALHNKGLKPIEGRLANCGSDGGKTPDDLHREVAKLWDNPEAQRLVTRWDDMVEEGTLPKVPDDMKESEPEPEPVILKVGDKVEVKRSNGRWTTGEIYQLQPTCGGLYPQTYVVKVPLTASHYILRYKPDEKFGYKRNIPASDIRRV